MNVYCPQCGSQRMSPEVRFCSRCGFNLETVDHLVATGGLLPLLANASSQLEPSPRKKGIRFGAKFMFASIASFPLVIAAAIAADGPGPLVVTFLLFLFGATRMAYGRIFEDDVPQPATRIESPPRPFMSAAPVPGALPSYEPPAAWAPRRGATTGELEAPASVTEHTTNLLDR